jgi:hypothetical protein
MTHMQHPRSRHHWRITSCGALWHMHAAQHMFATHVTCHAPVARIRPE